MTILDDLYAERYGRDTHAWWTSPSVIDTPERCAGRRRQMDLDFNLAGLATQETDELEQARERRAS